MTGLDTDFRFPLISSFVHDKLHPLRLTIVRNLTSKLLKYKHNPQGNKHGCTAYHHGGSACTRDPVYARRLALYNQSYCQDNNDDMSSVNDIRFNSSWGHAPIAFNTHSTLLAITSKKPSYHWQPRTTRRCNNRAWDRDEKIERNVRVKMSTNQLLLRRQWTWSGLFTRSRNQKQPADIYLRDVKS